MLKNIVIGLLFIGYTCISRLMAIELVPIPILQYKETPKILLGQKLFSETILSKNKKISCFSCHNLYTNGADTTAFTKGVNGELGHFNVPTVYNAVYNFRQFWDGRAKDLKEQALIPIENPVEMGNTIAQVLKDLKVNTEYVQKFNAIYKDGITAENIADALASFQSTLVTANSPFDKYLRGETTSISKQSIEGYRLFREKGCISCHNGVNIGGNLYNKFGIYEEVDSKELGRYNITQKEEDKYVFKVPSLRNIERTAPYMHDGRAKSLEDAVNIMSRHQLGQPMKDKDLHAIVSFLKTLNGELPQSISDSNDSKN
jgi:cytochrome c peroxidase